MSILDYGDSENLPGIILAGLIVICIALFIFWFLPWVSGVISFQPVDERYDLINGNVLVKLNNDSLAACKNYYRGDVFDYGILSYDDVKDRYVLSCFVAVEYNLTVLRIH